VQGECGVDLLRTAAVHPSRDSASVTVSILRSRLTPIAQHSLVSQQDSRWISGLLDWPTARGRLRTITGRPSTLHHQFLGLLVESRTIGQWFRLPT